jgi:hypothetical protein
MLCYRTKQGKIFYSQPVEGEGEVLMQLQGVPANNVVIAVVCNTDYIYKGEETRKQHFDYRLRMGQNVYQPAKAQLKWYNYRSVIRDQDFISGIKSAEIPATDEMRFGLHPAHTVLSRGEQVWLNFTAASQLQVPVRLVDDAGRVVCQQSLLRNGYYDIPTDIKPGLYILQAFCNGQKASVKVIVK